MKKILLSLLIISILVNFIAVLGPELGFDALWYHLTIPKIYLMWGKIAYIPGGLLYYSAMPRLGEFIYLIGKANDTWAHFVNFFAGILAAFITYKLARKYLNQNYALLATIIFYATPLVGWQSGSAYVDLLRTFFEVLAFYLMISKKPVFAGIAIGLAISTKTLSIGSLAILFVISGFNVFFLLPAIIISVPWFIWAYNATGFPFFPIGSSPVNFSLRPNFFNLFTEDKLNPIYFLILPFLNKKGWKLILYVFLAFVYWQLTPQNGGGRFLLPYLPVWAVLVAIVAERKKIFVTLVILFAVFSVIYRTGANLKIIPYLLGRETKTQYLCKHLEFSTLVFADCDGWFAKNIKSTDLVLVRDYHNLYYVDFPFVHQSWYQNQAVDYILTFKETLNLNLVYENNLTGAMLYKL